MTLGDILEDQTKTNVTLLVLVVVYVVVAKHSGSPGPPRAPPPRHTMMTIQTRTATFINADGLLASSSVSSSLALAPNKMEERSLKPNDELVLGESLATVVTTPASQPRAPSDEGDAPVQLHFSSSSSSDDEGDAFEFEFPSFVSRDSDSPAGTAAAADELFADGVIRPLLFYPVFGGGGGRGVATGTAAGQQPAAAAAPAPRAIMIRGQLGRLFLEESRSSSTSSSSSSAARDDDDDVRGGGGLEGAPPESYCLWTPGGGGGSSRSTSSSSSSSPAHRRRPPRKSSSTGSMARWRRISELVVGRSHSDGKEKFMFFPAPPAAVEPVAAYKKQQHHHHDTAEAAKPSPPANGRKAPGPAEVRDAAHRRVVAYGGVVPPGAITPPRRTFLPYREELVGFFANVNGVTRSHRHPF